MFSIQTLRLLAIPVHVQTRKYCVFSFESWG